MNLLSAYKQVLKDIEDLRNRLVILEKPTIKKKPGRPKKPVDLDNLKIPVLKKRPRKT